MPHVYIWNRIHLYLCLVNIYNCGVEFNKHLWLTFHSQCTATASPFQFAHFILPFVLLCTFVVVVVVAWVLHWCYLFTDWLTELRSVEAASLSTTLSTHCALFISFSNNKIDWTLLQVREHWTFASHCSYVWYFDNNTTIWYTVFNDQWLGCDVFEHNTRHTWVRKKRIYSPKWNSIDRADSIGIPYSDNNRIFSQWLLWSIYTYTFLKSHPPSRERFNFLEKRSKIISKYDKCHWFMWFVGIIPSFSLKSWW